MNLTIDFLNGMGKEVIRDDKKSEGYDPIPNMGSTSGNRQR